MRLSYQIPIWATLQGASADFGNGGEPKNNQALQLNIQLLDDNLLNTIYLDDAASTIRQVLTLSAPVTYHGVIDASHNVVASQSIEGRLTILQAVTAGVLLDTGAQPVLLNASTYTYRDPSYRPYFKSIPVSGSFSLFTGGKTYPGSFNYNLTPGSGAPVPWLFTSFILSPDQSSLTVGGLGDGENFTAGLNKFVQFTADNGFEIALQAGVYDDHLNTFSWSSYNVARA